MSKIILSSKTYFTPTMISIFLLGFSSGLPFLLTLATLHIWLAEIGINKTTIGLFALVTVPYSLKFIWAPIIDQYYIPVLSKVLGHKKSWMIFSQIMLVIFLICLGHTDPQNNIVMTAIYAMIVAFFSSIQDIIIEAYRVDKLDLKNIGFGAGASNLGYRLGMWVSGAGALYIASSFTWSIVYITMACCMIIGIITALLINDHKTEIQNLKKITIKNKSILYVSHKIYLMVKTSFGQLKSRENFWTIVLYIFFFKALDTSLNIMANPFLLEIGFNIIEIAHIGKSFGIGAMITGGMLAGILLSNFPIKKILILCTLLQSFSAGAFLLQNSVGNDIYFLILTVGIENLANGMGAATFIAYLSITCKDHGAGATFALLTSIASLARVIFSYISGWCAHTVTWEIYFSFIALLCIPNVIMLLTTKKLITANEQIKT